MGKHIIQHFRCAPWCSGYHYCTTSFNKAWTQVLRRFKPYWWRVGDSRWWGSLTVVPAGNKSKCLSSVNHTTKRIHHYHHHHHHNMAFVGLRECDPMLFPSRLANPILCNQITLVINQIWWLPQIFNLIYFQISWNDWLRQIMKIMNIYLGKWKKTNYDEWPSCITWF